MACKRYFLAVALGGTVYRGGSPEALQDIEKRVRVIEVKWFSPATLKNRVAWRDDKGLHIGTPIEVLRVHASSYILADTGATALVGRAFFLGCV
jgi:hypothetical protein